MYNRCQLGFAVTTSYRNQNSHHTICATVVDGTAFLASMTIPSAALPQSITAQRPRLHHHPVSEALLWYRKADFKDIPFISLLVFLFVQAAF